MAGDIFHDFFTEISKVNILVGESNGIKYSIEYYSVNGIV